MIKLLTSDAPRILSSLTHTNLMCRTWFVSVHSRNSKLATRLGFTHTPSFIFAAVSLSPHRLLRASGRFLNGHAFMTRGLKRACIAPRYAGTYARDIFERLPFS